MYLVTTPAAGILRSPSAERCCPACGRPLVNVTRYRADVPRLAFFRCMHRQCTAFGQPWRLVLSNSGVDVLEAGMGGECGHG